MTQVLREYQTKRRFAVTPEPSGRKPPVPHPRRPLAYVIQKHRATALHYDLRLEWTGVLLSWAVPKGPSSDPTVKRLAMPTEDHPLEYATFEGVIPAGEYGGGTVMIWDRGTWIPEVDDVDAALAKGDLKFRLDGQKLRGSWVLVRIRGRAQDRRPVWLLIKHRDEFASTGDITEAEPHSVVSNRLLAEIARDENGDMARAADGDPAWALREVLANPARASRPKRGRKSVGRSAP